LTHISTIQRHQYTATMMDDRENGMIAACPRPPEVRRYIDDRRMTIDTILDRLVGSAPDRTVSRTIGPMSQVTQPCPAENFVSLSLAVDEALNGSPRRFERFLPADPTIRQLLQARGAAGEMAREPAQLYLRFLYSAILSYAVARETLKWSAQQRPPMPLPKWRFSRVTEYIDRHIEQPIRLQDLAKAAGLSRMHFAAQFREYTGISPCRFVMMQRIRHAQVLLRDPRRTLADVAFSIGFRTQAHFTTVFHRYVGHTPNCWRKALVPADAGTFR
jgi:AraC-like DNA-binding protein